MTAPPIWRAAFRNDTPDRAERARRARRAGPASCGPCNRAVDQAARLAPEFLWFTDADIAHSSRQSAPACGARRSRASSPGLADGAASLPQRRRTFPDPGLRLLLRHAVSFRRGERSAHQASRRRPAAACWRGASALEAAGGIAAIRHNIIDDCALGRAMKAQGPIWLGLTDRAVSLRPYAAYRRHPPHGGALGLCPARLFAASCWRAPCWGLPWSISRR